MLSVADLHDQGLLLLDTLSGSHAYGLATATSDQDWRGVFYLPRERFFDLDYLPQINADQNNTIYYELGRFVELLLQSNPNILELLAPPADCLRWRSPLLERFRPEWFLSRDCARTFLGYGRGQLEKMRRAAAYDGKNMMHVFRLLETGRDLARSGELRPRRPNRAELLALRAGAIDRDSLFRRAEALLAEVERAFAATALPAHVNAPAARATLVAVRTELYGGR